jgi:hypothetical protein
VERQLDTTREKVLEFLARDKTSRLFYLLDAQRAVNAPAEDIKAVIHDLELEGLLYAASDTLFWITQPLVDQLQAAGRVSPAPKEGPGRQARH